MDGDKERLCATERRLQSERPLLVDGLEPETSRSIGQFLTTEQRGLLIPKGLR